MAGPLSSKKGSSNRPYPSTSPDRSRSYAPIAVPLESSPVLHRQSPLLSSGPWMSPNQSLNIPPQHTPISTTLDAPRSVSGTRPEKAHSRPVLSRYEHTPLIHTPRDKGPAFSPACADPPSLAFGSSHPRRDHSQNFTPTFDATSIPPNRASRGGILPSRVNGQRALPKQPRYLVF